MAGLSSLSYRSFGKNWGRAACCNGTPPCQLTVSTGHVGRRILEPVLMGSGRVRRHSHHHARSTPPCGVSCGPRACQVRVPTEIIARTPRKVVSQKGQVLSDQSGNMPPCRKYSDGLRRTGQIMNGCCCPAIARTSCADRTADNMAPFHPPNSSACRIINMLGSANGAALNN